jgi:CHAD domain-containing protein
MKELKRYARKQFKALSGHLKAFRKTQAVEGLHDIRVSVKKIKALLHLLKYSDKRLKAHKAFIPFRTIFRRAGEIRDPEVHAGLLLKLNVSGLDTSASGKKTVASFIKDIPAFRRKTKAQVEQLKAFIKQVKRKDLKKFTEEQEKEIRSKLYPRPVMEEIHKVRKAMKTMIYLAEIERFVSGKTLAFYREMEEAIGDFHDKQVVLGMLSKGKLKDDTKRKVILRECRASSEHIKKMAHHFYHAR